MELLYINTTHLDNSTHVQFHADFHTFVNRHDTLKLKIAAQLASYINARANLDAAFKKIRKSKHTADIKKADHFRDETWKALKNALKWALNHSDPEIQKDAETVKIVFDTYGKLDERAYDKETADIDNMVQDLEEKYSKEVATAELTKWVTELKKANEVFKNLMLERYDETVSKTVPTMRDARLKIDEDYYSIVKYINAAILIEGEDDYSEFVTAFNAVIKRYLDIMAQRKGRAAAKKAATEE
jgi:hypothetical protein